MSKLRITGRPKIERDPNGLRKITRTYVGQGDASDKSTIEAEVFLPFGTPDVEYDATTQQDLKDLGTQTTGAYLVAQQVEPGQTVNEFKLTRVYQELDASSDPVQIGGDVIAVSGEDRVSVKRTFIVKNPYVAHYASGRVGVDSITVDDGTANGAECILGQVQSKATEVYTEFIEVYYEDGVLSAKVDYRYGQNPNHKLEVRTLRGVAKPALPPSSEGPGTGPWFEIESSEGPGNSDYGQIGKTIYTVKYAKGYGKISEKSEVKGKPPNTVEVKTVQFLTGENGTVPTSAIPNFTRETFRSIEEKDGYELHTIRGVDVSNATGVVDAQVAYKHGHEGSHKLEIIQSISYGQAATIQNVIDFVYPSGDPHTSLGNFVIISESEDTKGEFDVFKNTLVRGNGLISDKSEVKGKPPNTVEVKTIQYLTAEGGAVPTSAIPNFTRQTFAGVDKKDGYDLHTIRGVDVSNATGVVDAQVSYKHGDEGSHKLELIQSVSYGQASSIQNVVDFVYPSGDPYTALGNFVIIAEAEDTKGEFDIFRVTIVRGTGLIGESTKKVGLTEVSEQVHIKPNGTTLGTALGANELSRKVDQKDGYEIVSVTVTTHLSGVVDEKIDEKHNGALTILTRTQLGSTWDAANTPAGMVLISERNHSYQIYPAITKVFASGAGQILVASKESALFTTQTYVQLGGSAPANAVDVSTSEESGYTKVTYSLKVPNSPTTEDESKRISSGLIIETTSSLDNNDWSTGEIGGSKRYIDSDHFIGEEINVEPDATFGEASYMPGAAYVKKITTTTVEEGQGTADPGAGLYASYDHLAPGIYKKTTVSYQPDFTGNSVEIARSTVEKAGYTLTKVQSLGAPIYGPGFTVSEDESIDQYGIQRYTTVTAAVAPLSYNLEGSTSFGVPTVYGVGDNGITVKRGYTREVAVNIGISYSTTNSAGSSTYTPPSCEVSLHVSFVDDATPVHQEGGGPNSIYEYYSGASFANQMTSFQGKAVDYAQVSTSGNNSMPQVGAVLGFTSAPILECKNGTIYKNTLTQLAQSV